MTDGKKAEMGGVVEGRTDDARWWQRMDYLFQALPFSIRHTYGGDAREMVEGIDWALEHETPEETAGRAHIWERRL